MFGFSTGRAAFPNIYTVHAKKASLNDQLAPPPPTAQPAVSEESLEPAIDGPPSPERIRAYTEQMKRSSIFGNNSRTNTLSSATSSFRSHDSTSASAEHLSLSRRSSSRSNASSMPSNRSERRESVQIFGSIFSRGSRIRRNTSNLTASASSLSVGEGSDAALRNDQCQGMTSVSRRSPPLSLDPRKKHLISHPYNFQHVTHTLQEQLPNLHKASGTELVSEFSAIRASQAPTRGELKGIRVQELREINGQDMHFENFSSEAVNAPPAEVPGTPMEAFPQRQRQSLLRKPVNPQHARRQMTYTRSYENLQTARSPPPRPPRSPLSPTCPVALPARTSSRTVSVFLDNVDPLSTTSIDRPYTATGFRRPSPFGVPVSPPQTMWSQQQDYFSERPVSHAVTTPGDEAWPLTASTGGNIGAELGGIQEEDEDYTASRRSRVSTASGDLRLSRSVPALRRNALDRVSNRPETRMSTTLGRSPSNGTSAPLRSPLPSGFQFHDSWEDDIDFMYEHEAEADCDYQWDRTSIYDGNPIFADHSTPQPALELHLGIDDHAVYRGRHRPSLVVPTAHDVPELSPMSNTSSNASPDLRTPRNVLRPPHIRSPSHASSFKESHGFTLSPTLLIPTDFQTQVERDVLYDEHYRNNPASGTIFEQEPFNHPVSPIEETTSSTASFRSSNLSGRSARSSSSTRISGIPSHDSVILQRSASVSQAHRSIGSAVSLPDLIPSRLAKSSSADDNALFNSVAALKLAQEADDAAPAPEVMHFSRKHRYSKSVVEDKSARKGINHFAPSAPPLPNAKAVNADSLSPIAQKSAFDLPWEATTQSHGRKISAPVSPSVREFKGRPRAATSAAAGSGFAGKQRSSYMLFPQV